VLRKELQLRLIEEYRYAVTRMQQEAQPTRKLFYFSVFYGEAQRILNFEWNRDLALIYAVTFHVYTQINTAMPSAALTQLTVDWPVVYDKLTLAASDLVAYLEKAEGEGSEELCQILGRLAEISFLVSGNGVYLYEKGSFKF
jgi:hypothetical protein